MDRNKLLEIYSRLGEKAEWIEGHMGDCHWLHNIQKKQELILIELDKIDNEKTQKLRPAS